MAGDTQFRMNRPTVISLLYIGSFLAGITTIVGIILAYVWRNEPHAPWEDSHYRYLIRTFWLGFGYTILGVLLMIVGVGFLILAVIPIWFAIRAIRVLMSAQREEALHNPDTLLF
jgi:uncharacterized membrane protein